MWCHQAAAFARLAEALFEAERSDSAADVAELVRTAQAEVLQVEVVYNEQSELQVRLSCSLAQDFPVWLLLAQLAGLPHSVSRVLGQGTPSVFRVPNQPPPPTLAKLCDKLEHWPPAQRLTPEGARAVYFLVQAVGGLLDEFGIRWWMSSGALLGTIRNAGMLPQDCDVDIALWRPDAHRLISPAFKAALAAAGVISYHMPIYFQYRFCLAQAPAAADTRSVHGGLACYLPYIDAHLADVMPNSNGQEWHYIHRTDLQYAHSFPLQGIHSGPEDRRVRMSFGEAAVWAPGRGEAEKYLSKVYGQDWRHVVRGRSGTLIYNSTESFMGQIARPTGPLRDVVHERPSLKQRPPKS